MDDCPLGPKEDGRKSICFFLFITREVSVHSPHHYTPSRTSIGSQSRNKMVLLQ